MDPAAIQSALREFSLDGWLLYDFRNSNVLARRVLELDPRHIGSRRLYYLIPAEGAPRKLVHRIESGALDHLSGAKQVYLAWQELEHGVGRLLDGMRRVAMEYSPRCGNPYVARVDAGTLELVRSFGVEVISSGDLIQQFEAAWDEAAWQSHCEASRHVLSAFDRAWEVIAHSLRRGESIRETEVQQAIVDHLHSRGVTFDHPAIVAVGPHSGDPHYAPSAETDALIRRDDFVLVDIWGKLDRPGAVYADYTRVGFAGDAVPQRYEGLFRIVAQARDAGIDLVRRALAEPRDLCGYEVDQAVRRVIEQAGYGPQFVHRTGHSIGQETHGNGANMDNLETRDERRILRRTCFSIEPGIYLDEFGVRSEVDVFIDAGGAVHVTGDPQRNVKPLLA